ncbi:zinc finger, CCHC-type containing protein [Tanacetum coccineum]
MVINSPCLTDIKNWLVQKQMAFGKDFSNPFTADSLLKTIWFSTHHASHAPCYSNEALAIPEQTATAPSTHGLMWSHEGRKHQWLVQRGLHAQVRIVRTDKGMKFLDKTLNTLLTKMTTSVGNNSVFRSFFEKQKLTGPNFIDWYRQLRLVLSTKDKEKYLEQPIPAAPVAVAPDLPIPHQALATYNEWVKNQKEIDVMMLLTMDLEIQRNLAYLGANDMLIELKALYSKQAEQELLQTVRDFHTCKQEEVSLILVGLSMEYDSFVQNYNMHSMGKTVNELYVMLKLHEETLPNKVVAPALHAIRAGKVQKNKNKKPSKAAKGVQGKGKGKKAYANAKPSYASKPKNLPPPKKDNPAKYAICHHCGEVGHWRRNCPTYLTELLKKKELAQGASTSGIFTIELYSFPSTSWVYDTGCGTHIYNTTQGLRGSKKMNPRDLSLYVGWKRISDKRTKNQVKNNKTEHGMEKRGKDKVKSKPMTKKVKVKIQPAKVNSQNRADIEEYLMGPPEPI